jgi:D-alanyl-D-alanine carboxypeptidase (penicillin-binding protein 5/6)
VRGRGLTIYATILGSPTRSQRNADLERLIAYGLSRYEVVRVIRAGRPYASTEVGYGRAPVALVATKPALRVVRVGRPLVEMVSAPAVASLPVAKGQPLGEVRIYAGGKLLASRPLVATRAVPRPGVGGRVEWYAGRTVHHLFGFL